MKSLRLKPQLKLLLKNWKQGNNNYYDFKGHKNHSYAARFL